MNAVDIAILVVLAVLLARGLWVGLVRELCGLAGVIAGALLAGRYAGALTAVLLHWVALPPTLARAACLLLLFLLSVLLFHLCGLLLSKALQAALLGGFNRVSGGLFGLVKGVVLLSLLLYGLAQTDWLKEQRSASRLAPPFEVLGGQLLSSGRQLLQ